MSRRALGPLLPVLALLGWAVCGEEPMTEEDVVRLFVAGRATAEIEAEIARREPDFDLSPEMLEELRRVPIPEELIAAMQRRRAAVEPEPVADPLDEASEPEPLPTLRLRFDLDGDGRGGQVSLATHVDPQFAAEWELGNAPEDRAFSDLALFVACTTPEHVPDQWRIKSPLGRDFETMRRHRMLVFLSGRRGEAAGPTPKRIKLEVPAELDVALDEGEYHDVVFGLAAHIGGRYRVVTLDSWPDVIVDGNLVELPARAKGRSFRTYEVGFVRPDDDETADERPDRPDQPS